MSSHIIYLQCAIDLEKVLSNSEREGNSRGTLLELTANRQIAQIARSYVNQPWRHSQSQVCKH